MELINQELTKSQTQGHPKLWDDQVLGLGKNSEPVLTYQQTENPDLALLDKAFDILFEETLKKFSNLTTNDN